MSRRNSFARAGAILLAAVLAFTQVAVAALAPPARTPAMEQARAEGAPCHETDASLAHLCFKKNCQDEAQKNDAPGVTVAPASSRQALRVDPPRDPGSIPRETPESVLVRATSPPPEILFARRLE